MTPETAQSPSDTPTCAELRRKADDLLNRYGTVMDGAASGGAGADQARREALLTAALRELRAQFAAAAISEAYVREVEADAEARGFERGRGRAPRQRPGRHSAAPASRWQQGVLRVVPAVLTAAAASLRALGAGLRHSPAAQHAAAAASWAGQHAQVLAAGGAAGGLVLTAVLVPAVAAHPAHAGPGVGASVPAPAASAYAAVPIAPLPAGTPVTHGRADVKTAGQLPGPGPSATPAPSSPPAPAAGLDATQASITLRPFNPGALSGELDLSASGAAGSAVSWQVTGASEAALLTAGVSLDSWSGVLTAGGVQVVTVTVPDGTPAGSAVITIAASGQVPVTVAVTWGASPPS